MVFSDMRAREAKDTLRSRVMKQIDILHSYWPKLNPDRAVQCMKNYHGFQTPQWAPEIFALIRPGFFPGKYGEGVYEVFTCFQRDLDRKILVSARFKRNNLRRSVRTANMLGHIAERQKGSDILIVPGQVASRFDDCGVRAARGRFLPIEFGFGLKDVMTIMLANPHLRKRGHGIECGGDEYSPRADGVFDEVPYLYFSKTGDIEIDTCSIDRKDSGCTVASGIGPRAHFL